MFSIKRLRCLEFAVGMYKVDCGIFLCLGRYQMSFVWHRHITPYDRARCKAAIKGQGAGQGAIEFVIVLGLLALLAIIILAILPISVWQEAIQALVSALAGG